MSTLLQSIIAETLTNYSQTNKNTPSHHVRKEGWSEVWGGSSETTKDHKNKEDKELFSKSHQLLQYRIGWSVQLMLRQCNIPHLVVNSPYLSNQSTGSFPQYRNLNERVMVGNEDILPYLATKYNIDHHLSPSQKSDMICLVSLINDLNEIQKVLRYGDADAWNAIYRKQCIKASTLHQIEHPSEDRLKCINGFAWFQAWAERTINLKCLKMGFRSRYYFEGSDALDVDKVLQLSKSAYQALDRRLADSQTNSKPTLLSTEALSSVDMLLFEHLAHAMCDVHLVTVLDGQKHLIRFFQDIYHQYFKDYTSTTNDLSCDWVKMNNITNALNQFNCVPLNDCMLTNSVRKGDVQDVIAIMQRIAVHCHDLQEILADMAIQKKKDDKMYASETGISKAGSMFHKVCMLGELSVEANDDGNEDTDEEDGDDIMKKNRRQMKKMMKDAKKNDELWISGVLIAAVIGLLSATSSMSG